MTAEADGKVTFGQMRLMVQSLMAERFKFEFHRETRQLSIYKLTVGKSSLRPVQSKEGSCIAFNANAPLPAVRPGETIPRICGGVRLGRGLVEAYGTSMSSLSSNLSDLVERVVIDDTGLKGVFDIHLEFTPDQSIADTIAGNQVAQTAPSADSAPSIFAALQQVGLKLEPAKGPVEVLVIDHVERPTEN